MVTKYARTRTPKDTRQERIQARVTPEHKRLLARAAALQGQSLSEFIVGNAREAAEKVIRNHEIITLTVEESINFAKAVLDPPEPSDFVRSEMLRYRRLIRQD